MGSLAGAGFHQDFEVARNERMDSVREPQGQIRQPVNLPNLPLVIVFCPPRVAARGG